MARSPTIQDLIIVLQTFFPIAMEVRYAFLVLTTLVMLYPIWELHRNQRQGYRQPGQTAWLKSILSMLLSALQPEDEADNGFWHSEQEKINLAADIVRDADVILDMLGLDQICSVQDIIPDIPLVLCTHRKHCLFCGPEVSL